MIDCLEDRTLLSSAPIFSPDNYTFNVSEDASYGTNIGSLSVSDPDGDLMALGIVSGNEMGHFAVDIDSTLTVQDTLDYELCDSYLLVVAATDFNSNYTEATVAITIDDVESDSEPNDEDDSSTNNQLVAMDDFYSTLDDDLLLIDATNGLLGNDVDDDDDLLSVVLESAPINGNVFLNPNGSFSYMANPSFVGADSFSYRAFDGLAYSALATVNVNVFTVRIERRVPTSGLGFFGSGSNIDVTDSNDTNSINAWVGEEIVLFPVLKGPGAKAVQSGQWSIEGSAIRDYEFDVDEGKIIPLPANPPLDTNSVITRAASDMPDENGEFPSSSGGFTFYWIKNDFNLDVQLTINFAGGQSATKKVTFDIDRPTGDLTVVTDNVEIFGQAVRFGIPNSDINGIDFYGGGSPSFPDLQGSKFEFIQVMNNHKGRRRTVDANGNEVAEKRDVSNVLDVGTLPPTSAFYPGKKLFGEFGEVIGRADSPQQPLPNDGRYEERRDDFSMYLMWQPKYHNSIWIPLVRVDWFWAFKVESDNGTDWSHVSTPPLSVPTSYGATTINPVFAHPVWNGNTTQFADDAGWVPDPNSV